MSVLTYPEAKPLNWHAIAKRPDRAKVMVRWSKLSMYGKVVRGSLFFIAALDEMDKKAIARFGSGVRVIQTAYNTGVSASEGTHDYDYCIDWDIPGVSGPTAQRFARFECGMADWYRTRAQGFPYHQHGFFLPPGGRVFPTRVGLYIDGGRSQGKSGYSSQLQDYWNNAYGLSGLHYPGSDPSPFPSTIAKQNGIFKLDRYIQLQREKDMEYKDWSDQSKNQLKDAVVDEFERRLKEKPLIEMRKPGKKPKGISVLSAIQRLVNGDTPVD